MTREFIILPEFDKQWKRLGLNDNDLINLDYGKVIQGTGGLRKLRWAVPGKGKSSGIRILYIDFIIHEKLYLITVFKKNEIVNLNNKEKNEIKGLIKILIDELRSKNEKK